jgi:hypothetical protein
LQWRWRSLARLTHGYRPPAASRMPPAKSRMTKSGRIVTVVNIDPGAAPWSGYVRSKLLLRSPVSTFEIVGMAPQVRG